MLVASRVAPGKPEILHCQDLPAAQRRRLHGEGSHGGIGELAVDQPTTVTFEFLVGEMPVATGGRLFVVWRWPLDWSDLQTEDAAGDGYLRSEFQPHAGGGDDVALATRYQWIAGIEPWHHVIEVRLQHGSLRTGDRVRLVCGDTSAGGGGWRAPTCAVRRAGFLMLIDHAGNGQRRRLVDPPGFRIRAGRPQRLVAVAPSDGLVGQTVEVTVRAEDGWGNPARLPAPPALEALARGGTPADCRVEPLPTADADPPISKFRVTPGAAGQVRFRAAAAAAGLTAESNPLDVAAAPPRWQLLWGDLHSGQTEIGCGAGSLAEHYAFGRDCAALQFITHQANDHYVTRDEWLQTRETTAAFYEPGRYVPLLGCEWSALTKDGGDRNVFYREDEPRLRRSDRFFVEEPPDPEPDVRTAPEFHAAFGPLDVLVNIHVGGRPTNLDWYHAGIERLCEIHSTHGTVEWFVHEVLRRGYRVGITAGTDGVMGRPGADHPGRRLIRNLRGGLTAVYADGLTREALWEALEQRRCYATSGPRIRLWFEVDGAPMGSELPRGGPPTALVRVRGTGPLERVDLLRGVDVVHSWPLAEPAADDAALLRVLWGGTERQGTARLQRVRWDGSLTATAGTLEPLETVNRQSVDDTVTAAAPNRLEWRSATAGNATGIVVRVRGDHRTQLRFETPPASFQVALEEVLQAERIIDAGGVGRFVKLGPAPRSDGSSRFEATWTDPHLPPGVTPYWVRVVQVDQAMAWSSPVYVGF